MTFNKVHFSSTSDHYSTPKDVYDALNKEFGFNFDPCPLHGDGGLSIMWGSCSFINPPYSCIKDWLDKGWREYICRGVTCVFLIPSRTDTKWWHEYVMLATEIRFIKGRLKFGNSKNSAPFPSCIVIFDSNKKLKSAPQKREIKNDIST